MPLAALAVGLALVAVVVLVYVRGADEESGGAVEREDSSSDGAPLLRGTGTAGAEAKTSPRTPAGEAAHLVLVDPTPPTEGAWDVEVLDYREAGVAGVEVFHEIDLLGAAAKRSGKAWKVLARGTTDAKGRVYLAVDPKRRRRGDEGLNHRLRVVPPAEREDLHPTWRLWMVDLPYTYRLTQSHRIEGRVLDAAGEPVWAATVWVGHLPSGSHAVVNPAWMETKTDPDGRFGFAGIPTSADWRIDVWAVAPGKKKPASSREVKGAQNVALDSRTVELRLE